MANVLLVCSRSTNYTAATTSYILTTTGRQQSDANEDRRYVLFREAGTFSDLSVNVSANTTTANSTVTLRKNATTDGNLTLTIGSGATGMFEDTAHTDSSAAGDKWATRIIAGATGTTLTLRAVSVLFGATSNTMSRQSILVSSTTATTTTYFAPSGSGSTGDATEANTKARIRQTCTAKNLYVRCRSNSKAGNTPVRTRKNGANGNNVITIGSSATGDFEDTGHTDSLAAGDDFDIAYETSVAGTIICNMFSIGFETTDGKGWLYGNEMAAVTQAEPLTRFYFLAGCVDTGMTTESIAQIKTMEAFTFSQLTIHITANGVTGTSEFRFRKNSADGNQLANITTSATGYFTDTTNSDICDADDLICADLTTPAVSGTPTITVRAVSVTMAPGAAAITKSLATETISITESPAVARLTGKIR